MAKEWYFLLAKHCLEEFKLDCQLRRLAERTIKGYYNNAKAKGAKIGRPLLTIEAIPTAFLRHYPSYKKGQLNLSELARVCDLSRTTVYKYITLVEE